MMFFSFCPCRSTGFINVYFNSWDMLINISIGDTFKIVFIDFNTTLCDDVFAARADDIDGCFDVFFIIGDDETVISRNGQGTQFGPIDYETNGTCLRCKRLGRRWLYRPRKTKYVETGVRIAFVGESETDHSPAPSATDGEAENLGQRLRRRGPDPLMLKPDDWYAIKKVGGATLF